MELICLFPGTPDERTYLATAESGKGTRETQRAAEALGRHDKRVSVESRGEHKMVLEGRLVRVMPFRRRDEDVGGVGVIEELRPNEGRAESLSPRNISLNSGETQQSGWHANARSRMWRTVIKQKRYPNR